jgi:hypothetical protein
MRSSNQHARVRQWILGQVEVAHAQAGGQGRLRRALKVTVGNTDLPAFLSNGELYIQAPLPSIFDAFAEDLPEFIGDLEIRVSRAGGGALPLDRHWCPVSGSPVALPCLVPDSGEW